MNGRAAQRRENVALVKAWARSIYDGRELRGTVTPCDTGEWLAATADGRILGTSRTERLAVRAVLDANAGRRA